MIYTKGKVTYYMEKSNVPDFETATGTIDYGFTNDYVFRKILQENNDVLKALICSILHMEPDGIKVTVTNPISLGETFSAKDFILDVRVVLNDGRLIDLSRIDLATEEDRHYEIDRWAKLFKTKTWEDLRMITKNNETMQKAADSLYQLNSDAVARQCAQSRADAAYWETIKNNKLRYLEEANSQLTQTIDQQASQIDQQTWQINQQASRIAELEAALAKQNK